MRQLLPFPRPLLAAFALLGLLLTAGYSSGPASSNGSGFTGAPSAGGGQETVCATCHSGGAFGSPRLQARFAGMEDLRYVPGQTYSVTVSVRPEQGSPAAYGFQAQFLDGSSPILQPAGNLSAPDAATQIATLDNGRSYAEHKGPNTDSLFTFDWTAPTAGTGPVTLYLTGNLVNRADGERGDNGSSTPYKLTLTEGSATTSVTDVAVPGRLLVAPNPTAGPVQLQIGSAPAGPYTVRIIDAGGRIVSSTDHRLSGGTPTLPADLTGLPSGLYYAQVSGPDLRLIVPVRKQ